VVEHLASGAPCSHEARVGKQAEVFLHRLARHGQLTREVGRARLAAPAEQREQVAARAVRERAEDGVRRIGCRHQAITSAAPLAAADATGP
jgi:hypothetical protein